MAVDKKEGFEIEPFPIPFDETQKRLEQLVPKTDSNSPAPQWFEVEPATVQNAEVLPAVPLKSEDLVQLDGDFAAVRDNILDIIEKSKLSLEELMSVASNTQHPRAYEVLHNFIKIYVESNEKLIAAHKARKEAAGEQNSGNSINISAKFTGTTKELADLLKQTAKASRKKKAETDESDD